MLAALLSLMLAATTPSFAVGRVNSTAPSVVVDATATPTAAPTVAPTPTPKPLAIPSPGATPWGTLSLAGVSLGDSLASVISALGLPLTTNTKGDTTVSTYAMDMGHVELVVLTRRQSVINVSAALRADAKESKFADPFGVHLGENYNGLVVARGQSSSDATVRAIYYAGPGYYSEYLFDRGIVRSISVVAKTSVTGPIPTPTPGPNGHDGDSLESVIRFKAARTDAQATVLEVAYLGQQRCDGQGTWSPTTHASISDPASHSLISVWTVVCTTTQREAKFYFDHTGLRQH